MQLWILGLVFLFSGSATAGEVRLAVLDFLNASPDPDHAPLSAGLRSMLITDLSRAPRTMVVERERLEAVLSELELQRSEAFDPATAVRVGKLAGATHLVDGSLVVVDETMRLDARLVDVSSGTTLLGESIEGERLAFFELEKALVKKLLSAMAVELAPKQRAAIGRIHTADWDAFVRFSEGLAAFDAERYQDALDALDQALLADSSFELAELTQRELNAAVERLGLRAEALRTARVQQEALQHSEEAAALFAALQELEALAATTDDASRPDRMAALALLAGWYGSGSFGPLQSEIDRFEAKLRSAYYLRRYLAEAAPLAPRVAVHPPFDRYLKAEGWRSRLIELRERIWGDAEEPGVSALAAYRHLGGCASNSEWGWELYLDFGERYDHCLRGLQEARALGYPEDRADTWRWGLVSRLGAATRFGDAARLWLEIGQETDRAARAERSREEIEQLRRYMAALDGAPDRERALEALRLAVPLASGRSIQGVPMPRYLLEHDDEPYARWARTDLRRLHQVSDHDYILVGDVPAWPVHGRYNLESGPRTDLLRTSELVYHHPTTRGTLRSTEPRSDDSLVLLGRGPADAVELRFTAFAGPGTEWWPKHQRPLPGKRARPTFDDPRAPITVLVGARDWDVARRETPGGGRELHRPFRAWGIEIADDAIRLVAIEAHDGDRRESRFRRTELDRTARKSRGSGDARIDVRVDAGGAFTVRIDRKSYALRIPDYVSGFAGLYYTGTGWSRIGRLELGRSPKR